MLSPSWPAVLWLSYIGVMSDIYANALEFCLSCSNPSIYWRLVGGDATTNQHEVSSCPNASILESCDANWPPLHIAILCVNICVAHHSQLYYDTSVYDWNPLALSDNCASGVCFESDARTDAARHYDHPTNCYHTDYHLSTSSFWNGKVIQHQRSMSLLNPMISAHLATLNHYLIYYPFYHPWHPQEYKAWSVSILYYQRETIIKLHFHNASISLWPGDTHPTYNRSGS